MSDRELIEELTAQARHLEDSDGGINPFLVYEYDLLTKAARRLDQLSAGTPPPG